MDYNNIQITHVVNPHKFWFKISKFDVKFIEFDISLQNYLKIYGPPIGGNNSIDPIDPDTLNPNQVVVYFDEKWQRWFRGTIQDKTCDNKICLFLQDFGFPIETNLSLIRKIPIKFQLWVNENLKFGAINQILPAKAELNVAMFDVQMSIVNEWSNSAISIVKKIIDESSNMYFISEFELNGQLFGKLYASKANVKQEISNILMKLQHAVFVENISEKFHNRPVSSISNNNITEGSRSSMIRSFESSKSEVLANTNEIDTTNNNSFSINNQKLDPLDPIITSKLCISKDELVEIVKPSSPNSINLSNKPESCSNYKTPTRKLSNQSESSSFSESKIFDYSESDIDSCISSSPHLAKIFNKMRTIRNREQTKSKIRFNSSTPDMSTNNLTIIDPTANTNTHDMLLIENADNNKTEVPAQAADSKVDDTSDKRKIDTTNSVQQPDNSSLNSSESIVTQIYQVNTSQPDGNVSKNPFNSNILSRSLENNKTYSDTSSIGTSTIITNDSARHSNSADNESSPSNLENKSALSQDTKIIHHKILTKKHNDSGIKYEKSSDVSNSSTDHHYRTTYTKYDTSKYNVKRFTFFEKEQKQIVLVHGHTQINPVVSLDQINFSRHLHQALDQLALNRMFRIDSYTWPHCLSGTSFVVIGAEKTGKTISYLPPLINLILMEEEDNCTIDGVGSIALIVAPTYEKVSAIYYICKQFIPYLDKKLTICKSHGVPNEKLAMKLLNGVHILISTPGCLDRLFDSSVNLLNSERIKFLVIDDYHLMIDQINLIKKIIRSSCILNPETELYEQQIIVTSVYWHHTFMSMLNKTNNSFICIGSYMESAYYAKQDIKLLFMRQDDKLNELNKMLSNKDYRLKHTLVVCRDSAEVEIVVKYLSDWTLDVVGCSRHHSTDIIIRIINEWNDRNDCNLKIVVCTDDILPELHLSRVKVLIHFSLSATWSKFQYRYSTFFESMPNLLKKESKETKSVVFIDETNNSELPRFIDFLKIHGVKQINPAIEHVSNEIRNQREIHKATNKIEFCKYVLKSGVCRQQNVCQFRHVFTDLDKSIIQLDIKKYIKLKVGHVYSPAHFYVNILSTRDTTNDAWIEFDKENYKIFNIKFKLHYSVKTNHMQHTSCRIGDLCTINIVEKFYRCKIISVGEKRGVLSDRRVVVKAIDAGEIYHTTESRLLLLPDHFKIIPPRLVDIRLGGLIPLDNELKWDGDSTLYVKNYFDKHVQNPELFLEASACFIISDTILIDSMVYKRDLGKFGGGEIEVRNFKSDMIGNTIGISDEKSFDRAKDLIRAADIKLFELKIQSKNEQINVKPVSPKPPPNEIIPRISHQISTNKNYLTIPTVAEKPSINLNKNSNSHFDLETNISDDITQTKLSNISTSSTKKSNILNKPAKTNRKLGVSLTTKIESINLCCFNSPLNFFVQKMSSLSVINTRLHDIQEYLIESDKKKLVNFSIGDMCLVLYDGYYDRAEIISICNDDEVFVNICDLGFSIKYGKNDLYEIEDAIKNQPFEAIECQLFGLKPIDNDTWDEKCIDDIYDYINDNYLDHYVKKVIEIKSDALPKFSVMFCGVNGDKGMEIINKVLVEKGWAKYKEEVQAVFDQSCKALVDEFDENIKSVVVDNNDSTVFDEELFFNSLSYEECIELFNFPEMMPSATITEIMENDIIPDNANKNIAPQNKILPSATITEITNEDVTVNTVTKSFAQQNNPNDQIISYGDDLPPLVSCYNLLPLETLWYQDATSIILKVNVTDHINYRLEVHKRLVYVCVQFDDQTYREITINLFGVVNIQNFVNTVVGNYLKILLTKSIRMNLLWPRLLRIDRKLPWLRYNYDTFKDVDLNDDYIQYKIKCVESSSDTESDEQLDEDDECDPLSTQYNFVENKFFDESDMKISNNA